MRMSNKDVGALLKTMMEVKKVLIVYHRADFDGRLSAVFSLHWLLSLEHYHVNKFNDVQLYGVDYGDDVPDFKLGKDTAMIIADFSYPVSDMKRWEKNLKLMLWFDHHRTSIQAAARMRFNPPGRRTTSISACQIVWEELVARVHQHAGHLVVMSKALEMVSRYDRWDTSGPFWPIDDEAFVFQMGLEEREGTSILRDNISETSYRPQDYVNPFWNWVMNYPEYHLVLKKGLEVVRRKTREWRDLMDSSFVIEWEGLRWLAVNASGINSQAFAGVFDPVKHDAMLYFSFGRKGGRFQWDVHLRAYDAEKKPVRRIAEMKGGGGHDGAAGFYCDVLPFDLPNPEKVLAYGS